MHKLRGSSLDTHQDVQSITIYLALGSNIRPRKHYLLESIIALHERFPSKFQVSECYITYPYMGLDQSAFFNCCVGFETNASAMDILSFIKGVEAKLGRKRDGQKWASRTIDIDILFFGKELIDMPDLTVPHYDVSNRDFFLMPMLDLDNSYVNPRTQKTVYEELQKIPKESRTFPKLLKTEKRCEYHKSHIVIPV